MTDLPDWLAASRQAALRDRNGLPASSVYQSAIAVQPRPPLRPQRAPFGSRPMPRQMRGAGARAADPRLAPAERARAYGQVQRTQEPPRGEAYAAPRNQFAEAGQMAWEGTGVPAAGRSGEALRDRRYGDAAWEGGASLLALGSLALPLPRGGGARIAPRPMAEPPPAIRPPPRLPGRASDGSVLPVRPPEPFRNSLRGGSDDLMEAAQPTSDAVQPNTPRPTPSDAPRGTWDGGFYRGMTQPLDEGGFRATVSEGYGDQGPGVSITRNRDVASEFAGSPGTVRGAPGANVSSVEARGPFVPEPQFYARVQEIARAENIPVRDAAIRAQAEFRARGFTGTEMGGRMQEVRVWPNEDGSVTNVRLRPSSDATRGGAQPTSDGGNARPPPDLNKSYRRPKPPSGGFLLPRRR